MEEKHHHEEEHEIWLLRAILIELRIQTDHLRHIERCVCRHGRSATLSFEIPNGENTKMPLTVHINDKPGTALFQEWSGPNGTGTVVPPVGAVTYESDTPTVATVDPTSGQLAYVSAGNATISGKDAGNGLTASDMLTVVTETVPAVSATLTLTPGA